MQKLLFNSEGWRNYPALGVNVQHQHQAGNFDAPVTQTWMTGVEVTTIVFVRKPWSNSSTCVP
jgi:hypothetical protein